MKVTEKLREWSPHPISQQEKLWYTIWGTATERLKNGPQRNSSSHNAAGFSKHVSLIFNLIQFLFKTEPRDISFEEIPETEGHIYDQHKATDKSTLK